MTRIAFVISNLHAGGAQRVVSLLADQFAARNVDVSIITMAPSSEDFFEVRDGVRRFAIGGIQNSSNILVAAFRNIRRIASLRSTIRVTRADTVISFVGISNILTVLACIGLRQNVVVCERNDPNRQSLGRIWDIMRRWLYRLADKVTANSREALRAMNAYVPEHKLVYLPNPLAQDHGHSARAKRSNLILTVGRLTHQKAHDITLAAFAETVRFHTDWHLVMIGEGELEASLRRQAEALEISSKITWIPRTEDVWSWYHCASIFVLPSRFEGTPNALIEALSCALPSVITTTSSGALDYVTDGVSGLIIPPNDPQALSHAVARLIEDDELRIRLGKSAQQRVRTAAANAIDQWLALLGVDATPALTL